MVAWKDVCRPRALGGLGIRNIQEWNEAAIGKYVWNIAAKKDSLFVKWINSIYLMNGNWWEYSAPIDASWYWKRIVGLKSV